MAIFTILYDNYYPPHGEFKLICIGKFARRIWVNFTQQYGKNRQRCQQNKFYYAVWQLLFPENSTNYNSNLWNFTVLYMEIIPPTRTVAIPASSSGKFSKGCLPSCLWHMKKSKIDYRWQQGKNTSVFCSVLAAAMHLNFFRVSQVWRQRT